MNKNVIYPKDNYVFLSPSGEGSVVEGGEAFWAQAPAELDKFGSGWLVTEYEFAEDWKNWEIHPAADELVYLLEGEVELVLDLPQGEERLKIRDKGAVLVPRGVWHTARTKSKSRMLFVTMGAGTQHRALRE